MSFEPSHPYEPHAHGNYCGAPDPTGQHETCARSAHHPIHAVDTPEIDDLARRLAAHQWRTGDTALAQMSEHRRHNYNSDCAICVSDLHAIAAAVLALLAVA